MATVTPVMVIHLFTEQVGQNEWQKQQEMTVVTRTGVSGSFLLV
jgi:high-affinity nickel permease